MADRVSESCGAADLTIAAVVDAERRDGTLCAEDLAALDLETKDQTLKACPGLKLAMALGDGAAEPVYAVARRAVTSSNNGTFEQKQKGHSNPMPKQLARSSCSTSSIRSDVSTASSSSSSSIMCTSMFDFKHDVVTVVDDTMTTPWNHGILPRETTEARLAGRPPGTFLVRTSPKAHECVLSVVMPSGAVAHMFICGDTHQQFYIPRKSTAKRPPTRRPTVEALVDYYTAHKIDSHTPRLQHACPRPTIKQ